MLSSGEHSYRLGALPTGGQVQQWLLHAPQRHLVSVAIAEIQSRARVALITPRFGAKRESRDEFPRGTCARIEISRRDVTNHVTLSRIDTREV